MSGMDMLKTHQRMRKMKARPRQIIPVTFSSLQHRLKIWLKLFANSAKAVFSLLMFSKLSPGKVEVWGETGDNTSTIEEKPGEKESPAKAPQNFFFNAQTTLINSQNQETGQTQLVQSDSLSTYLLHRPPLAPKMTRMFTFKSFRLKSTLFLHSIVKQQKCFWALNCLPWLRWQ